MATNLGWTDVNVTYTPRPPPCRLDLFTVYWTVMIPTIPDPSWMWQS
jgi:hypothetical protein